MSKKISVTKAGRPARGGAEKAAGVYPMLALRDQMDRVFDDFMKDWRMPSLSRDMFNLAPFEMPSWGEGAVDVRFDVSETPEAMEITAELPGIDEKDVELTMADGVLTIKGEKKTEKETKERDYYLSERRYGSFSRVMRVPDSVDQDKIKASFDKGVLNITMPKRAEAKSKKKKIAIAKA